MNILIPYTEKAEQLFNTVKDVVLDKAKNLAEYILNKEIKTSWR